MARIRTIKPEFFTSADIIALSPLARLFYVSLWCEADREGLLTWNTETLKYRYFPKDKIDIEATGQELVDAGLIVILQGSDGKEYAEIPSFKIHQVINNRESESVLAERVKDASPRVQGEGRKEGKGKEGNTRASTGSPRFIALDDLKEKGVSEQVANDWLRLRKEKRAAVTPTVIAGIMAEATKAGLSLDRALGIACARGWQGFQAGWLRESDLAAAKPAKQDWL